jgi:hypothetical protein
MSGSDGPAAQQSGQAVLETPLPVALTSRSECSEQRTYFLTRRHSAGDTPAPNGNGHHKHLRELPQTREGQRLVRFPDWGNVNDGPYALLSSTNGRMVAVSMSLARAEDYLRQLAWREHRVQAALYHSELWSSRQGTAPRNGRIWEEKLVAWDVETEQAVATPAA